MDTSKGLSNINMKSRIKQVAVLLMAIMVGIAISYTTHAQSYHSANSKHFKNKYKSQIKLNSKVCTILTKKRTAEPKRPLLAFLKSKPKYRPQAEVDTQSYVRLKTKPILIAQVTDEKSGDLRE